MSQFEHRFQIVVAAVPAEVHALLSDPEVLPELHPLIERVWITERTRTADGELLVDVRGVPLVHVAKALAAVGKALG